MNSAWVYLIIAGVFETGWAIGLELSDGFTKLVPSIATVISMAISVVLLGRAVQSLPIGTVYAAWTGIGATATALLGILLFDETFSITRLGFIGFIVIGVAGLELSSRSQLVSQLALIPLLIE